MYDLQLIGISAVEFRINNIVTVVPPYNAVFWRKKQGLKTVFYGGP